MLGKKNLGDSWESAWALAFDPAETTKIKARPMSRFTQAAFTQWCMP
jgi:hypothetical protein